MTYAWSKQSGPGTISFGNSNFEDSTASASVDGTYVLRLTVTDPAGNSASDELTFVWNTTIPTVAITSPAAGSFINAAQSLSTTVSGSCSENGRAVAITGTASGSATCSSNSFSLVMNYSASADGNISILANQSMQLERRQFKARARSSRIALRQ